MRGREGYNFEHRCCNNAPTIYVERKKEKKVKKSEESERKNTCRRHHRNREKALTGESTKGGEEGRVKTSESAKSWRGKAFSGVTNMSVRPISREEGGVSVWVWRNTEKTQPRDRERKFSGKRFASEQKRSRRVECCFSVCLSLLDV
jgi:hypothetical protein